MILLFLALRSGNLSSLETFTLKAFISYQPQGSFALLHRSTVAHFTSLSSSSPHTLTFRQSDLAEAAAIVGLDCELGPLII